MYAENYENAQGASEAVAAPAQEEITVINGNSPDGEPTEEGDPEEKDETGEDTDTEEVPEEGEEGGEAEEGQE